MDLQLDFHSEKQEMAVSVTSVLALEPHFFKFQRTFKFLCYHWKISTYASLGSDFHFLNHKVTFAIITVILCWNSDVLPVADFQVVFFNMFL